MGIVIPFDEWTPELPEYRNGATEAQNVIPRLGSYVSFPGLAAYSTSLSGRCQGFASALDSGGATNTYLGEGDKLYRLVYAAPTDASKAGGYNLASDDFWEFAKWGERVIATNVGDPMQVITMGGTTFADLATSTLKPQARHIDVVREFVVIGNTVEAGSSYPDRVRWSAVNDATDWDQSAATQADAQDLRGHGGWVQRVVGGEFGTIFRERSIVRMTYAGSPLIFQFDEVVKNRGAWAAGSVVSFDRLSFYLSDDGFYMLANGVENVPIGRSKVDRYFHNRLDATYKHRISAAIDPDQSTVAWAFTTANSQGAGDPDEILIYDWRDNCWSWAEVDLQVLGTTLSAGYTLDGLDRVSTDLDALAFSLDSRVWTGGQLQLSAVDRSNRLAHFTGSALPATLTTREEQFFVGQRAMATEARPLVEGASATITAQVGTRSRQTDATSFSVAAAMNADGACPVLAEGRYHRARLNISGGFDQAQGVEVEAHPTGTQ